MSMKITVFGANNMVGKRLVRQALARGWEVIAFDRNIESLLDTDHLNEQLDAMKGYLFDDNAIANAIKDADAVVSAINGSFDGTDLSRSLGTKHLITQMEKHGIKRIVSLGGAAVLDTGNGHYLLDTPEYPMGLIPIAQEHMLVYLYFKSSSLDWKLVCPLYISDTDGRRRYNAAPDKLPSNGSEEIAAGDIADCMLNLLENDRYLHQRIGITPA